VAGRRGHRRGAGAGSPGRRLLRGVPPAPGAVPRTQGEVGAALALTPARQGAGSRARFDPRRAVSRGRAPPRAAPRMGEAGRPGRGCPARGGATVAEPDRSEQRLRPLPPPLGEMAARGDAAMAEAHRLVAAAVALREVYRPLRAGWLAGHRGGEA